MLPFRKRRYIYATEASAVRHAEEIVHAFPLAGVFIYRRVDEDHSDFVCDVAHPNRRATCIQAAAPHGGSALAACDRHPGHQSSPGSSE